MAEKYWLKFVNSQRMKCRVPEMTYNLLCPAFVPPLALSSAGLSALFLLPLPPSLSFSSFLSFLLSLPPSLSSTSGLSPDSSRSQNKEWQMNQTASATANYFEMAGGEKRIEGMRGKRQLLAGWESIQSGPSLLNSPDCRANQYWSILGAITPPPLLPPPLKPGLRQPVVQGPSPRPFNGPFKVAYSWTGEVRSTTNGKRIKKS